MGIPSDGNAHGMAASITVSVCVAVCMVSVLIAVIPASGAAFCTPMLVSGIGTPIPIAQGMVGIAGRDRCGTGGTV